MPEGIGTERDDNTNALMEVGKKAITDSIDTIKEYIKLMIPLTTGLITAYFALLEFLGVKTVLNTNKLSSASLIEPAMFMLASLIVFIIVSFPIPGFVDMDNLKTIRIHRNITIIFRYVGISIGLGFFLYAMYIMILALQRIVNP